MIDRETQQRDADMQFIELKIRRDYDDHGTASFQKICCELVLKTCIQNAFGNRMQHQWK